MGSFIILSLNNLRLEFVFHTNANYVSFEFRFTFTRLQVTILTINDCTFRQCIVSTYDTLVVFAVTSNFVTANIFNTEAVSKRTF